MALFDKFQARVGRDQGGNRQFIAADGYFNVGDVQGGADGDDILGSTLRLALLSPITRTSITLSTNSTQAANSQITTKYGFLVFAPITASTTSIKLPSAELGATLFMDLRAWQSDLSILPGNASIALMTGSDCSCILVVNGSVNSAWVELTCFTAGTWAVSNQSNRTGVSAQVSS